MTVPINWVTSDFERWGVGLQRLLDAFEIDRNFWELKSALEFVIEHPPSPVEIVSFTVSGLGMSITMSSGSVIGPLPLPILAWRWRDVWLPSVPYAPLDVFQVVGVGIFLVLIDHTSDSTFDPDARDLSNNPLYRPLFGGFVIDSITTGIAAAGSNQSGATALTTNLNFVNTAVDGTHGVRVASSLMLTGLRICIANEDATSSLRVYPAAGVVINRLSANAPITVPPDSTAMLLVKSATALRSVP